MIACTSRRFDVERVEGECGKPATLRVTITGADRADGLRETSYPTPWNLDKAPRCDACARMDRNIVARMFSRAHFDSEPIQ